MVTMHSCPLKDFSACGLDLGESGTPVNPGPRDGALGLLRAPTALSGQLWPLPIGQRLDNMWSWIKRVAGVVDGLYTVVDVLALHGVVLLPLSVTTSNTLRGFIAGFAILGGVLGYFLTATAWVGRGGARCLRRRNLYLSIFWIPLVVFVGTLVLLRPEMAIAFPLVRRVREFLLNTWLLPNVTAGCGAGFGLYFLVAAITLSSPKLARLR